MQKLLIVIIGIILSSSLLLSQSKKDYELGDSFMQAKQYEKAIEEFSNLISKDPKDVYALYKRGVAFLFANKFDDAIRDFTLAIDINGDDPDSYNNRGLALSYQGDLVSAISDFDKAIKLDPNFAQAYINRGSAYIASKDFDKAIKDLDKAIKFDPKNPEIFLQRARLYYNKEEFQKSVKDYSSAIALGIGSSKVYYNRANAYFKLEKYDEAIKDYSTALELDPDDLDALNNRAYTYKIIEKEQDAERDRAVLTEKRNEIFTPVDQIKFNDFTTDGGELTFEVPSDWNIIKMPFESEDKIEYIITPEKVDPTSEGMIVGVTVGIMKNLSKFIPVQSEPEILDFWKGSMDMNNEEMLVYRVMWQRHLQLFGHATILNRSIIQATENHMAFGMFEYVIAWGDNMLYLYYQAPEANFDYYEKLFEKSYRSVKVSDVLKLIYD